MQKIKEQEQSRHFFSHKNNQKNNYTRKNFNNAVAKLMMLSFGAAVKIDLRQIIRFEYKKKIN